MKVLNFLTLLTNEEIGTYIYNRYNKPRTLKQLWDRVDNASMILGLCYEYHSLYEVFHTKYLLFHKYPVFDTGLKFFCTVFHEGYKYKVDDCTKIKEQVPGLEMLEDLYRVKMEERDDA